VYYFEFERHGAPPSGSKTWQERLSQGVFRSTAETTCNLLHFQLFSSSQIVGSHALHANRARFRAIKSLKTHQERVNNAHSRKLSGFPSILLNFPWQNGRKRVPPQTHSTLTLSQSLRFRERTREILQKQMTPHVSSAGRVGAEVKRGWEMSA